MKKEIDLGLEKATNRLKEIRESSGLNQKDFAELFGANPTTYNRYEKGGIGNMPRYLVQEICERYNINPSWLMGFDSVEKHMIFDKAFEKYKRVPVLGTIAAGIPILAQESLESYEQVPENSGVDFCLKVKGDSMIGARIFDGDTVFIHQQPEVDNGEIAAVIIDGEVATLKRVFIKNGSIILHAENPTYPDMIFTLKDKKQVNIIGKVKYVKFEAK